MHVRHESLFRWLKARFPYARSTVRITTAVGDYYQFMWRGTALQYGLMPVLEPFRGPRSTPLPRTISGDEGALRAVTEHDPPSTTGKANDISDIGNALTVLRMARSGSWDYRRRVDTASCHASKACWSSRSPSCCTRTSRVRGFPSSASVSSRPDLALFGYLVNARVGAAAYNATHAYIGPALAALAALTFVLPALPYVLIWAAHIAFDRALGYGLKSRTGFRRTHVGLVGRAPA